MDGQGPLGVNIELEVVVTVEDADGRGVTGLDQTDFTGAFVLRRTSDAVVTATAITLAASGDYAITEITNGEGDYTINIPASGGASFNNDTEGQIKVKLLRAAGPDAYSDWIDIVDNTLATEFEAILGGTSAIRADVQEWVGVAPDSLEGGLVPVQVDGFDATLQGTFIDAIWDEAKAGHVAAGSFGEEIQAHALSTEVSAVETKVDTIDGIVDDILVDTGTTLDGKLNTIDANVDLVLEDTGTTLPGTLSTIEGKVDTIDTEVGVIDGLVDAIKVVTDHLADTLEDDGGGTFKFTEASLVDAPTGGGGGSGATAQEVWEYATRSLTEDVTVASGSVEATLSESERNAIADALLSRDLADAPDSDAHDVLNALRALRNKVVINRLGSLMTVYKENGIDVAWTATLATEVDATGISGITPNN